MADRDAQLDQAERDFTEAVAAALTETADEFADAVLAATEVVAARFSVSRIARMWGNRTRGLVRRLLGTAETAATAAAEDIGEPLPDGWDDLPGRYDDDTLPEVLGQYVETTEHLLRAVGDRLAEAARAELASGIDAGEDIEQLRARLRAAFTREGAQLGPVRERRIAQTEASRAWNTSTLAAAQAASGPDRPVVKQWVTRHDRKVRTAHDQADGQIRLLAEPFTVGGVAMQTPGDPSAPAALVINCRCRLAVAPELRAAAIESQTSPEAGISDARRSPVRNPILTTFHGTPGRPSYRKYHPNGGKARKGRKTQHRGGGWLGSSRFSEEEHTYAMRSYTGKDYMFMNECLRKGCQGTRGNNEMYRERISALSDLMNIQDPTTEEIHTFRGMKDMRLDLSVGDEFHDSGFISTSADESIAMKMAGFGGTGTIFRITTPPGAQVLDVVSVGGPTGEAETILPPGTKYRVKKVVNSDNRMEPAYFELEVINA
ncbi:ADP-ribosyltransferase [Streptomyces sp. NPDC012617]|uniref:ADP-ribosyltransferase n=1 Tax=Streptomyces TaxID=1883 RepID=UPI0033C95DA3